MRGAGPFVEVADGVFHGRYRQWDVGVGLVVGSEAALVVDTRASEVQGREVVEDIRRMGLGVPVTTVVCTHVHFDHTFGNRAFAEATIHTHERVLETYESDAERLKALVRAETEIGPDESYSAQDLKDVLAAIPRRPDLTFSTTAQVDLGDRVVELAFAGRGHTDGDIRIAVPDTGVVFLGDLVEESAAPSLGIDSWPLDWAVTLDRHLAAIGSDARSCPATAVRSTRPSSGASGTRWPRWPRSSGTVTPRAYLSCRLGRSRTAGCPTRWTGSPTRSRAATASSPAPCPDHDPGEQRPISCQRLRRRRRGATTPGHP
jgi:glyoxylase-like metal-dependent hydrolase (beta-lactamase superfamily II)